jgi:prevent-host-death family protein
MRPVSISELKAGLSRYLRAVRRGGEVQILERGVPVAKLVGMPSPGADRDRVARLVRAGVLSPGGGGAHRALERPPLRAERADVSGALSEDREDRV